MVAESCSSTAAADGLCHIVRHDVQKRNGGSKESRGRQEGDPRDIAMACQASGSDSAPTLKCYAKIYMQPTKLQSSC